MIAREVNNPQFISCIYCCAKQWTRLLDRSVRCRNREPPRKTPAISSFVDFITDGDACSEQQFIKLAPTWTGTRRLLTQMSQIIDRQTLKTGCRLLLLFVFSSHPQSVARKKKHSWIFIHFFFFTLNKTPKASYGPWYVLLLRFISWPYVNFTFCVRKILPDGPKSSTDDYIGF